MSGFLKKLLIIPPVLAGIAILLYSLAGRDAPERAPPGEVGRKVRVIEVPELAVVPRALGYGAVEPATVWEAVAEVGGRVAELHRELKRGALLPEGTLIVRIDPADYELAIAQAQANLRSARAELAELEIQEANTRASLEIEERSLGLARKELERKRTLAKRGTIARSVLEEEERSVLGARQGAQSLNNSLNLIPAQRDVLKAKLAVYQAQLSEARLDLERTAIVLPFAGRIAEVKVEEAQFVNQGAVLAVADSIDVAEVTAQLPLERFRPLVPKRHIAVFLESIDMARIIEEFGLSAVVRLRIGDFVTEWPARFDRLSAGLDPQTRTIGVIVAVDEPYRQAKPGIRPALAKGMFVEVEVRGRPRPDRLVVPRDALHDGRVYVADSESRLRTRPVRVAYVQTGFAVIVDGLEAGARIVVSDVVPAIEGMLLDPVPDEAAAERLRAQAEGKGPVR